MFLSFCLFFDTWFGTCSSYVDKLHIIFMHIKKYIFASIFNQIRVLPLIENPYRGRH